MNMRMRRLLWAAVPMLLFPAAGWAQGGARPAEKSAPRPIIEIPAMSFDFGTIYHQDQYAHEFIVKNTGTADLVISDVKPG